MINITNNEYETRITETKNGITRSYAVIKDSDLAFKKLIESLSKKASNKN